jgi:hypothetical protein
MEKQTRLKVLEEVKKVFTKFDNESRDFVTQLERLERWLNKEIRKEQKA